MANILEMANRRAKLIEILHSGVLWDIICGIFKFNHMAFKVSLAFHNAASSTLVIFFN